MSSSSVPAPNPVYPQQLEQSPFPQHQHSHRHYQSHQQGLYISQQQHHHHHPPQGHQEPVLLRHRDSLSTGEIQHQHHQQSANGDPQEASSALEKTPHSSSTLAERTPHWTLDPQAISLSPDTNQYPPQPGPGSTPSSTAPYNAAMRYHHAADMAVPPTMDRYDDGRHGHAWPPHGLQVSTTTVATSKSLVQPSSPYEPKKRPRKQSVVEANVPEDEKKRARGRPRLDTKDQTPAERRRTQIRLAQRAYRSRKETAISELETKVQSLKDVNDEISAAVQELCLAAKGRGILDQAPEFHRQIQRLQILTKRSRDTSLNDEELPSPPGIDSEDVRRGSMHMSSADPASAISEAKVETTQSVWGSVGSVMVPHDHIVRPGHQHGMAGSHMSSAMEDEPVEYEVLAVPTPSNASFSTTAGPYAYDSTSFFNPMSSQQWGSYPWSSSLPGPGTMAYHESSFARRLHRSTKEMAARLITMDSPPVDRMLRVFGFSRLFESIEQIRERTLHDLTKTKDEPLCNYNYPFQGLGNSGNHFPGRMARPNSCANPSGTGSVSSSSSSSSSNGGSGSTIGVDQKSNRIGPQDPKSRLIRDRLLDIQQHMHMPALSGSFWDCDEVEYYLAENGISIPSPTDFQAIEIQPGAFPNGDIAAAEARAAQQHPQHASQNHHPQNARQLPHGRNVWQPLSDANPHAALTTTTGATGSTSFITAHSITGSFDGNNHNSSFSAAAAAAAAAGLSSMGGSGFGTQAESTSSAVSPTGAPILAPMAHTQQVGQASGATGTVNGRRATLDVGKFLMGLGSRAVCLGRTPGFRAKDIDQAFWESITME